MIKIKGVREVRKKLETITKEVSRETENEAVQALADEVYNLSQRYVPVLTGQLKKSGLITPQNSIEVTSKDTRAITTSVRKSGDILEVAKKLRVEYNTPYARKINYLHKKRPFFLTRAYLLVSDKAVRMIKPIIAKKLR